MAEKEKINKITEIINDFCKNETSIQRKDLYAYLNQHLELIEDLTVYDYQNKTSDHTRFACDDDSEFNYVSNSVIALEGKFGNLENKFDMQFNLLNKNTMSFIAVIGAFMVLSKIIYKF